MASLGDRVRGEAVQGRIVVEGVLDETPGGHLTVRTDRDVEWVVFADTVALVTPARQVLVTPGMLARYAMEVEMDPAPRPVGDVMVDVQNWAASQPLNVVAPSGQAVGELMFASLTRGRVA